MKDIWYEPVGAQHIEFLYQILKERPKVANISHKTMPTMEQHTEFVNTWTERYREWWVIWYGGDMAGNCYLTKHNEYGMFIKREFQGLGIAIEAFKWIAKRYRDEPLYSNINPRNTRIRKLLQRLGCTLVQETWKHP